MMKIAAFLLSTAALTVGLIPLPAQAQDKAEASAAQVDNVFGALPGRWVRPDGGYVIDIRRVDASGKLDASYANPNPLPFSRAEATRDGKTIRLFFELRYFLGCLERGEAPQPGLEEGMASTRLAQGRSRSGTPSRHSPRKACSQKS